jgi:hypothetical protein
MLADESQVPTAVSRDRSVKCKISRNHFAKILLAPGEIAETQNGDNEYVSEEPLEFKEEESEEEAERLSVDKDDDEADAIHCYNLANGVEILRDAGGYVLEGAPPYNKVTSDDEGTPEDNAFYANSKYVDQAVESTDGGDNEAT